MALVRLKHLKYLQEKDDKKLFLNIYDHIIKNDSSIIDKVYQRGIEIASVISYMKGLELSVSKRPENPNFKIPSNVDSMSFITAMDLFSRKLDDDDIGLAIGRRIAIYCFSSNYNSEFDMESDEFNDLLNKIMNMDLQEALRFSGYIIDDLNSNRDKWDKLFKPYSSMDQDYAAAGGHTLSRFNTLNLIKKTCQDFNCNYKESCNMSYGIVMANSLSTSAANAVQNKMTEIKKRKMKQARKTRS